MRFHLERDGQVEGPYEETILVRMIRDGLVPLDARVRADNSPAFFPIHEHASFRDAFDRPSQRVTHPSPVEPGTPSEPGLDRPSRRITAEIPLAGTTSQSMDGMRTTTGARDARMFDRLRDRFAGPLSTRKLVAMGLTLLTTVSLTAVGLSKIRVGFERAVNSLGRDLVDIGLHGGRVGGEWVDEPPVFGTANVRATDRRALEVTLSPLGRDPRTAAITLDYRLCGASGSVRLRVYVAGDSIRYGSFVGSFEDRCADVRSGGGRALRSAADSDDRRIHALGELGLRAWASLRDPACAVPMVTENELVGRGVPGTIAHRLVATDGPEARETACRVATLDSVTESPFVALSEVEVLLVGEGRAGVLGSRISPSARTDDFWTLTPIEGRILEP